MFTCMSCGLKQKITHVPCPDGKVGCCVSHFDKDSFVCKCGTDNQPDWENTKVMEEVGMAYSNAAALRKLKFS